MAEFSTTRLADFATAETNNAHLAPAVAWLQSNTAMGRLTSLEVWEALQSATSSGGFVITFGGNNVP